MLLPAGPTEQGERPLPRRLLAPGFLFGLVILAVAAWSSRPALVGLFHDDAVYAITAKTLAEGEGYRLTNLPGAPAQTKYPPVFPALLAVVWTIAPRFPGNVAWLTLVPVLAGVAAVVAAYRYGISRGLETYAALGIALASLSAPYWLQLSGALMSETLFTALMLSALVLARQEQQTRDTVSWRVGILLAAAALTRSVGLAVMVGMGVAFWRQRRLGCGFLVSVTGPVAAWFIWCHVAAASQGPAAVYYTNYSEWFRQALDAGLLREAVSEHLAHFTMESALMLCEGLANIVPAPMRWPLVLFPLGSALWLAGLLGCRRDPPALGAVLGYMGLVLVWPWPIGRFLLPMLPIVAMGGADWLLSRSGVRARRSLVVAAVLLLVTNAGAAAVAWHADRETGRAFREPGAPLLSDYQAMFEWIDRHVPPGETICALLDTTVALYTNRPTVPPYELAAKPVSFVIRSPGPDWLPYDGFERRLTTLARDGTLVSVYRGTDSRFEVLAVRKPIVGRFPYGGPSGPSGPTTLGPGNNE